MSARRATPALVAALEAAAASFDGAARLRHDPLGMVHAWPREEQEVVAHIAACLAYGAVGSIRRAIGEVVGALGDAPTDAVRAFRRGDFVRLRPAFVYRMTRADDVDALLAAMGALLREHGTLLAAFQAGDVGEGDLRAPLTTYVARLRERMGTHGRGARYLTPDPGTGSATKRWYLMLRWLVRPDDGVDLGLWSPLGADRLVLPLDTHVARLAVDLGLTTRRAVDYRAAREATDTLASIDSADPLRFDMPLCHMGVSGACAHRWVPDVCGGCGLVRCCVHPPCQS